MADNSSFSLTAIKDFILEKGWLDKSLDVQMLAAGEYNQNYRITHHSGDFVFRINRGSQLGLPNQIEYEFRALKLVEQSGVTPKAYCFDGGPNPFGGGVMLEEYIPGRPLNYKLDLDQAASIFAKIHNIREKGSLLVQADPFQAISAESLNLLEKYPVVEFPEVFRLLEDFYEQLSANTAQDFFSRESLCVVNTEVNSENFIIGEQKAYLVDWEKAVFSYRYQDLAHFVAPTTTLWKTDYRFSDQQRKLFLESYFSQASPGISLELFLERTAVMERFILLRALSWCYMAHYEYIHLPRAIKNEATFKKIRRYLSEAQWFLK